MATRTIKLRDLLASPNALNLSAFLPGSSAAGTPEFTATDTLAGDVHSWDLTGQSAGIYDLVLIDSVTLERVATVLGYVHRDTAETVYLDRSSVVDDAVVHDIQSASNVANQVLTQQMTESYAANGVAPTLAEAIFAVHQMLMSFGISGANWTVKKLDNSTTAFVVTMNDATNPTGVSRS